MGKSSESSKDRSTRERIRALIGTTPRARWISAATVVAVIIAIVAFVAIKPNGDEGIPRDAYTIAADQACLAAKGEIVAVERQFSAAAGEVDPGTFARELLPVITRWRSKMRSMAVPTDRVEEARGLEAALLKAELQIAALARSARHGSEKKVLESAKRADAASTGVEEAVAALGLSRCARARIGLAPS